MSGVSYLAVVLEHFRVGVKVGQQVVEVERKPAQRKHHDDSDQQLDRLALGPRLGHLLVGRDGAHVRSGPQALHDAAVGDADESEGQAVLQHDGGHR